VKEQRRRTIKPHCGSKLVEEERRRRMKLKIEGKFF